MVREVARLPIIPPRNEAASPVTCEAAPLASYDHDAQLAIFHFRVYFSEGENHWSLVLRTSGYPTTHQIEHPVAS